MTSDAHTVELPIEVICRTESKGTGELIVTFFVYLPDEVRDALKRILYTIPVSHYDKARAKRWLGQINATEDIACCIARVQTKPKP
jgi:hypothetical protein